MNLNLNSIVSITRARKVIDNILIPLKVAYL